jgi:hypothetical protein
VVGFPAGARGLCLLRNVLADCGGLFLGVFRASSPVVTRESNPSPSFSSKRNSVWIYNPTSPYAFRASTETTFLLDKFPCVDHYAAYEVSGQPIGRNFSHYAAYQVSGQPIGRIFKGLVVHANLICTAAEA